MSPRVCNALFPYSTNISSSGLTNRGPLFVVSYDKSTLIVIDSLEISSSALLAPLIRNWYSPMYSLFGVVIVGNVTESVL